MDTPGVAQKMNCADTQGFEENKDAATRGGKIAGDARTKLELESGKKFQLLKEPSDRSPIE